MKKWLYDNPWIWVVVFLSLLVAGSLVTVVIPRSSRSTDPAPRSNI